MDRQVTITLSADGGFILQLPSTLEDRSHVVNITADLAGIKTMKKILRERGFTSSRKEIGNVASPTQAMVDEWLRQDRINRAAEKEAAEEKKETERTLAAAKVVAGLDLGSLDL